MTRVRLARGSVFSPASAHPTGLDVNRHQSQFGSWVIDGDSGLDDVERARRMIRDHVRFVAQNPEFVRIMHDVGKRPGPRMEWLVDTHVFLSTVPQHTT